MISPYTGKEILFDKSTSEKTKIPKSEEELNDQKFDGSEELLSIDDDLILDEEMIHLN